jgi:hypothetical protein
MNLKMSSPQWFQTSVFLIRVLTIYSLKKFFLLVRIFLYLFIAFCLYVTYQIYKDKEPDKIIYFQHNGIRLAIANKYFSKLIFPWYWELKKIKRHFEDDRSNEAFLYLPINGKNLSPEDLEDTDNYSLATLVILSKKEMQRQIKKNKRIFADKIYKRGFYCDKSFKYKKDIQTSFYRGIRVDYPSRLNFLRDLPKNFTFPLTGNEEVANCLVDENKNGSEDISCDFSFFYKEFAITFSGDYNYLTRYEEVIQNIKKIISSWDCRTREQPCENLK